MKLIQKVNAVPLPLIETPKKEAQRLFQTGIEKHLAFNRSMKQARKDAFDSGFNFLRARAAFEQGEWGDYMALFKDKISVRSIQFYMQLAEQAIQWVLFKNPTLKDLEEIRKLATEMVMISPLPLVALCRELGHMMKFGGYFEEDYEKKKAKRLGDAKPQLEFSFTEVAPWLDALTHFGDENYRFAYPEGRDEVEVIEEVEQKLEAALKRVRMIKQHGKVVDI